MENHQMHITRARRLDDSANDNRNVLNTWLSGHFLRYTNKFQARLSNSFLSKNVGKGSTKPVAQDVVKVNNRPGLTMNRYKSGESSSDESYQMKQSKKCVEQENKNMQI